MDAVAVANATTFVLTALLGVVVGVRRPAAPTVHGMLLVLLAGIAIWSGGAVWRAIALEHATMLAAHHLVFLGVCAVPTTWLLLAATTTRSRFFEGRPLRKLAVSVPALLVFLGFVTNPGHGRFAHIDFLVFERGPLFWAMIAWAFGCSVSGTILFLQRARALARRDERRAAWLLALAAVVPQLVSATYLFRWIAWPMDPTPASLGFSAALLYPVILRLRAFEDLPLLRRDVIDHLQDAVLIADPEDEVVDHNKAAAALFGVRGGMRGRSVAELVGGLCAEHDASAVERLFGSGEDARVELRGRDGRSFLAQVVHVVGEAGWSAGRFVVLHDRSEEKQAERALRQAQKLESIGMLAAGIAHEVNNPLAYIRANLGHLAEAAEAASRLQDDVVGELAEMLAEMPDVVADTVQGIERIAAIVAGMKRLSREGADAEERLDANELVEEATRLAALSRDDGDVRVLLRLAPDLPPAVGSRGGLVQVLLNLLLNAKQAVQGRDRGTIRVTTGLEPAALRIDVEDDGPGVPAELVERVFDPFFTTRGPDQGTGLGLSIAFDVIRDHRGTIEAGPGELGGARFSIRLPTA